MRKPLECRRSIGAEFDTAILFTTRTLLEDTDFVLETIFSFTGVDDFALPNTMLFGFFASTLFVPTEFDFVWGFALLFVFTAMYILDSFMTFFRRCIVGSAHALLQTVYVGRSGRRTPPLRSFRLQPVECHVTSNRKAAPALVYQPLHHVYSEHHRREFPTRGSNRRAPDRSTLNYD